MSSKRSQAADVPEDIEDANELPQAKRSTPPAAAARHSPTGTQLVSQHHRRPSVVDGTDGELVLAPCSDDEKEEEDDDCYIEAEQVPVAVVPRDNKIIIVVLNDGQVTTTLIIARKDVPHAAFDALLLPVYHKRNDLIVFNGRSRWDDAPQGHTVHKMLCAAFRSSPRAANSPVGRVFGPADCVLALLYFPCLPAV
jgi:hypothetical protein